jgi:FHA domain-containing protein
VRRLALGIVLAAFAGPPVVSADAPQFALHPEPGVALTGGGALLPFRLVDSTGVAFPVRPGEVVVEPDGGGTLPADLVSFQGPDALPLAIDLLVDPHALRGADLAEWAQAICEFARADGSREERAVYGAGSHPVPWSVPGGAPPSVDDVRAKLEAGGVVPLWECTLGAIDRLSGPGTTDRRVLLLVADGEEGRESRHPAATCADAADTARVSVWILTPASAPTPGAQARLATLASRTGGAFVEARGRGAGALREIHAQIRAVQALRLSGLPASPPLSVTLKPGLASAGPGRAWIRARHPVGFAKTPIPWLPIGGALVVGLVAAGLVAARALPVGRVRGLGAASGTMVSVTRSGLTIGGAKGNGLVLADARVSRSHAVIRLERGRVMLVDLKSANGTKVNGRSVSAVVLRNGDRIVLADAIELLFEEGFRFGKRR